jgi:hypothetical protein
MAAPSSNQGIVPEAKAATRSKTIVMDEFDRQSFFSRPMNHW